MGFRHVKGLDQPLAKPEAKMVEVTLTKEEEKEPEMVFVEASMEAYQIPEVPESVTPVVKEREMEEVVPMTPVLEEEPKKEEKKVAASKKQEKSKPKKKKTTTVKKK